MTLSAPAFANGEWTGANPRKGGSRMHKYELVCIVHPDLDENAFNSVVEKVRGWIGESGGSIDIHLVYAAT